MADIAGPTHPGKGLITHTDLGTQDLVYMAVKMTDRTEKRMVYIMVKDVFRLSAGVTCDRGSGFGNWASMEERLFCRMYCADSYCTWQKETNENSNRQLKVS